MYQAVRVSAYGLHTETVNGLITISNYIIKYNTVASNYIKINTSNSHDASKKRLRLNKSRYTI